MKRQSEDSCLSYVLEGGKKRKEEVITLDEEEEDRNKEDNESSKRIEKKKEVKVLKSLGNCDVMEHLASYLNIQDLSSLNDTCVTVADSIDALSLWRKRAHKLSEILGCSRGCKKGCNRGCNKTFDYKSEESAHYRELCYSLQESVESKSERLRERMISRMDISLKTITDAACLAHHGMLGSLKSIWLYDLLENVDLSSVPTEHLASLVSCVTEGVYVFNVSNSDLTSILDSSKSRMLYINNQSLSTKETQAVVQAMANVEEVYLGERFGYHEEVRLDISTLVTYGGRGKCQKVVFYYDTADKYREEVLRWAHRISWGVRIERGYPFDGIIIESTPEAPEAPWC